MIGLCTSAGTDVPSVKLNNGLQMPVISFAAQVWDAQTCHQATADALKAGFRFVWSSTLIGDDCQKSQSQAIRESGVPRDELFIAGTVSDPSCSGLADCQQQTMTGAEKQFTLLGQNFLDMMMLDYPAKSNCESIQGQWQAFEELYQSGRVKSIAVSNFNLEQLQCITKNSSAIVPAVNQLPFSVGHGHDPVVAENAKFGIIVQAYSPLGSGSLAHDPLCTSIGKSHGKSSVQVALRWILQHNVSIATQSTNSDHLESDLQIFDFELTADEMKQLDARMQIVV